MMATWPLWCGARCSPSNDMSGNPLIGWTVDRSLIRTIGTGLQRPECILAERDGTLWSSRCPRRCDVH